MVGMDQKPSLQEMIDAVIKTFIVAHADDGDAHLAQALVYNAGRLAWRLREMGVDVEHKTSISDVVTDADRAAERFVAGVLEAVRPEDGILGEEGAARESQSGRTWVIDPVDGTYNFSSGSDYWCSALALTDATGIILGAVHRPAMGYTWFGGRDFPTSLDSKKVTKLTNTPRRQAVLVDVPAPHLHHGSHNRLRLGKGGPALCHRAHARRRVRGPLLRGGWYVGSMDAAFREGLGLVSGPSAGARSRRRGAQG